MSALTPEALVVQWRERAELLRAENCLDAAAARERCASELEGALHTQQNEPLSIKTAAAESGYSQEHLRRIVQKQPRLNAGREGKPLILRRDLPRKAVAVVRGAPYDPSADAQSLVSRQGAN